jgi:CxxC motif-containing protein (DUF1111 family)
VRKLAVVPLILVTIVGCTFILQESRSESGLTGIESGLVRGYFGEPISNLSEADLTAFNAGYDLFVKTWPASRLSARNADSCVSCHNIPMPGGSGTDQASLVQVQAEVPPKNRERVLQRLGLTSRNVHRGASVIRTRPLFGLGIIEASGQQRRQSLIGSFGQASTINDFVEVALANELGLSTSHYCARRSVELSYPNECLPEVSDQQVKELAAYIRFLAAPKFSSGKKVGESIFEEIGCASCHVRVVTVAEGDLNYYKQNSFDMFSDLKMHKIRGRWPIRTAPLWALNFFGPPYMHDACANSIEEAVLCHEDEGANSVKRYKQLNVKQQEQILDFVKGL